MKPVTCTDRQSGLTLVELIMFIMIVSVALAGVLLVMNQNLTHSADPLIRKQSLAIAESLLEEIELMPFTYCDPDDAQAVSATSSAGCTGGAGGANDEGRLPPGPETGETRYSLTLPFDNVSDYNGFDSNASGGVRDITNIPIDGLANYRVVVNVAPSDFGGIAQASGDALLITVTATGPDGNPVVLQGYRARYAPNAVP